MQINSYSIVPFVTSRKFDIAYTFFWFFDSTTQWEYFDAMVVKVLRIEQNEIYISKIYISGKSVNINDILGRRGIFNDD